jgi:large subunit ribosomal protein L24e
MPITRPCSFCGNEIEPGAMNMFVRRDGTIRYFCSRKCQRNMLGLRRTPREVKWTLTWQAAHGKIAAPSGVTVIEGPEEAEASRGDFILHLPKGKDIPHALVELTHKQLGRELSTAQVEKRFIAFSQTAALKGALAQWFKKKNPKKALAEVTAEEYTVFLGTAGAKKMFKDWTEGEAKKEKA